MVGLGDLRGLFQPECFCDSIKNWTDHLKAILVRPVLAWAHLGELESFEVFSRLQKEDHFVADFTPESCWRPNCFLRNTLHKSLDMIK